MKLNTSTKLNEMKKFEGLEFGNIQLTNANGQSVLLADVKNTTSVATKMMLVSESTQFSTSIQIDYANAYDFKITKK